MPTQWPLAGDLARALLYVWARTISRKNPIKPRRRNKRCKVLNGPDQAESNSTRFVSGTANTSETQRVLPCNGNVTILTMHSDRIATRFARLCRNHAFEPGPHGGHHV